jgi:hypothetical protein
MPPARSSRPTELVSSSRAGGWAANELAGRPPTRNVETSSETWSLKCPENASEMSAPRYPRGGGIALVEGRLAFSTTAKSDPHDEAKKDGSGFTSYVERANVISRARLQLIVPVTQLSPSGGKATRLLGHGRCRPTFQRSAGMGVGPRFRRPPASDNVRRFAARALATTTARSRGVY